MEWRRLNGYDWCVLDTSGAEPFIGLTLGYGLVHEPVEQFGTLQLLAGMLQAELSRPIETAPGQVTVPGVSVHVGTDTLDIGIRGEHGTVLSTWKRLVETFAGQHPLDSAQPVGVHINAAPRDLTSRFGMTSLTLGAADVLDVQVAHDPTRLLHHLNPAAGKVRAVICTNSEQLVGTGFAPPTPPPPTQPEESRYRSTARSGAMQYPGGHAILSIVVPRSADGSAAIRVLAQQTAQHLSSLTQRDDGVTASLIPVGPDMFATIMTSEIIPTPAQRSQVQQLLASRPIPDHRVRQAVEWEVEHPPLSRLLERRVHGLPDDVPASIQGAHQALALARSTLRFFTEDDSLTPPGFEEIPSELSSPSGSNFRFKAGHERLTIGSEIIEHYRSGSRKVAEDCDRVDLTRLELVIEDPSDCVVLIDDEFRVVEVIFDTFRNQKQLRELIYEKTSGVPRLTAHNAVQPGPARQRVKDRHTMLRWGMLTPVVVLLAIAASSLFNNSSSSGEPELELESHPYTVEADVGDTAATANGSRVTVHEVNQRSVDLGTEYVVALEYCAAEEHEVVNPGSFRLFYGEYMRPATPVEASEDALEFAQLTAGECTTGNAGFFIPEEAPTDVRIEYRSGDMASITWK